MSYEQRHTHDEVERLERRTPEEREARRAEIEDLFFRLIADCAQEAAAHKVTSVCEWLRSVEAEEIIEGADVARLQVGETLAVAIERRFGGSGAL